MDFRSFTPSDITETLKCFLCNSYLSYFPISLCSNKKSLCGRCTAPEGVTSFHNQPLETICLHLKFPCRYEPEGCLEELSPQDVPHHEQTCSFRVVRCVVNKPSVCDRSGSLPSLVQHCRTAHPEAYVKHGSTFEINVSSNEERDYLIEHGESFVIFTEKYECESKVLKFAVHNSEYLGGFEGVACQLQLSCGNTTVLHDFKVSKFEEKVYSTLGLPFINEDSVVYLAKIKLDKGCELEDRSLNTIENRSGFTCVYCFNLAMPPIYRRTKDLAVICYSCGGAGRRCSHCTIPTRVRDPILEQFAVLENYPCKNKGCTFVSTHTELIEHQTVCCYESVCCFMFACQWKGAFKDLEDHVVREHSHSLIAFGEKVEFCFVRDEGNKKILKFGKQLFFVNYFVKEDKRFVWEIRPLGQCTQKFKYGISIYDADDDGFVASMRQISLKNPESLYSSGCCYFDVEQVLRRHTNNKEAIKFSVHIFKC